MAGDPYYLDRRGLKMPLSQYHSARVPLVTGASEENLEEVHALASFIRKDEFLTRHVTRIHRNTSGTYVLHLREMGFIVFLGRVRNMDLKFKNFKAFYQKALQDKKLQEYEKIDLRFGNQVVCTKK